MRNPLNKRLPRELRANAGKYIGLLLIFVVTIMVGSAFMVALDCSNNALKENEKECLVEDGQFELLEKLDKEVLEELSKHGITLCSNFYSSTNGYNKNAKIITFNERNEMNLPSIFEGKLPSTDNEVAIDRLFAYNNNLSVGDEIELLGNKFIISATISLPDYTSLFKNNQDLMMNAYDFGVSIVTEEGFEKFDENQITYRYSYRFNDTSLTYDEKNEIVTDIQTTLVQNGANIQSYLTAKENQSITFLKLDMGKDGPVMQVFIHILILVIAFVFTILANNTIESEAAIIGTLRASGYHKYEIVLHYLWPTIIIALIGSIIGNILGYSIMLEPFKNLYYSTYCLPPMELSFNTNAFITTTILPILIMILTNVIILYKKLSLSPLKFLRKDLKKKKQKKAIHLPMFSFINRFRIRIILQNKVNYLILFFGIFISSFLLMFGIGLKPLMEHYCEEIDDTLPYEYQYILKTPEEIDDVTAEKMQLYNLVTYYKLGDLDINVSFMGITDDTKYFKNIKLPDKEGCITVTKPLAQKLNLKIGDKITFEDEYTNKEYSLEVTEICTYTSSMGVFMKIQQLNNMLNLDTASYNSYISNEKLPINESNIIKYITRDDLIGTTLQMLDSFNGIFEIVNVFSILIYIVIMYILTKTVIEKNSLYISFMKVFGYKTKEINKLYLNATTFTVIVSLFICIPIEIICFKYALVYISSLIEGYLPFYLPTSVYITILLTGIIAYLLINSLLILKVRKIPMNEALKNRE
ncbi:MAG: ABC transporter permease [Lachnospiraceae bacterium]|nr:ABC transporter permease [Lachnospiraceae bacterium]